MTITPEMCKTPSPVPDDYDWRTEAWLDETATRDISHYLAFHLITSLALESVNNGNEEDAQVFALLQPEITERYWKSKLADKIVNYRLVSAAAAGIDKIISQWLKERGSIDSTGPRKRGE